jgi:hypothetical protein
MVLESNGVASKCHKYMTFGSTCNRLNVSSHSELRPDKFNQYLSSRLRQDYHAELRTNLQLGAEGR